MSKRATAKYFAIVEQIEANEIEHWKRVAAEWAKRALRAESKLAVRNPDTAIGLTVLEERRRVARAA